MTSEIRTTTNLHNKDGNKGINKNSITYSSILIVIVSFILGAITALLLVKMSTNDLESFTVTELVSFIFGIALSSASTVLAIVAISLGKASEQAMIERSDNSIQLQNELFVRTTDALQKIQSSTGVTEKRIEDIIAGRSGNITEKIYESLLEKGGRKLARDRDSVERSIRQGLKEGLRFDPTNLIEPEKIQKQEEASKLYDKFQNEILVEISNLPNTQTIKLENGNFQGSGDELVDAIFTVGQEKIGVSVISNSRALGMWKNVDTYLDDLVPELLENNFSQIFLVFTENLDSDNELKSVIQKFNRKTREEFSSRFQYFSGDVKEVINLIREKIENI